MEMFRALTPFITLFLLVGMGIIGFFVRQLISDNKSAFAELRQDLSKRLDKMESDIEKIEGARAADQKWMYENCVLKETFYMSLGESKALIGKIFDELKEVNRLVNQTIGAMNARKDKNDG